MDFKCDLVHVSNRFKSPKWFNYTHGKESLCAQTDYSCAVNSIFTSRVASLKSVKFAACPFIRHEFLMQWKLMNENVCMFECSLSCHKNVSFWMFIMNIYDVEHFECSFSCRKSHFRDTDGVGLLSQKTWNETIFVFLPNLLDAQHQQLTDKTMGIFSIYFHEEFDNISQRMERTTSISHTGAQSSSRTNCTEFSIRLPSFCQASYIVNGTHYSKYYTQNVFLCVCVCVYEIDIRQQSTSSNWFKSCCRVCLRGKWHDIFVLETAKNKNEVARIKRAKRRNKISHCHASHHRYFILNARLSLFISIVSIFYFYFRLWSHLMCHTVDKLAILISFIQKKKTFAHSISSECKSHIDWIYHNFTFGWKSLWCWIATIK